MRGIELIAEGATSAAGGRGVRLRRPSNPSRRMNRDGDRRQTADESRRMPLRKVRPIMTRTTTANARCAQLSPRCSPPKLWTVLREGYDARHLRADAVAGLTVAIVALPLSMAIAIASGASPAQGLYTAIIGGFLVSLLGGSRFQIGGPAGAFIILVAGTVAEHGMDGLILATFLFRADAGRHGACCGSGPSSSSSPFPVTVGFTAGIAVIILASQINPLLGLSPDDEPGELVAKLGALWDAARRRHPGCHRACRS